MRLIKAEITGFGHFRQQQFDFLAGNQLFFGNNEQGKSTLYQFIQAMLFGFPKKSLRKRDYTPVDGAAYGGKLWLFIAPYGELRIERYRQINKGKVKVWIGEEERDEAFLAHLLSPLTQEVFQEVFTFQQEQLSEINRLQEKELQASLISLGINGSQQLREKILGLEKSNQQLFKPRGQRLPLNQRLNEWQQLKETITQKETQEHTVQQAFKRAAEATSQQKQLQQELQQAQKQQQHLNQQKMNWQLYEEWQTLHTIKKSTVSPEDQQQLQYLYQEYQQLSEEIRKHEAELSRLEQGQETDRYFFYLDQEAAIQNLLKQEVALARLSDEQARLQIQRKAIEEELEQLSRYWGWQLTNPPQPLDKKIYQMLDQLENLAEQTTQQELRIKWLQEQIQPLEAELTSLEKQHPDLLNQTRDSKQWLAADIAGVIIFGVSFLVSMPLRLILLLVGILCMSAGIGWQFYQKQQADSKTKLLWQEKLSRLDQLNADFAAEKETLEQNTTTKEQLIRYLQPSFGNNQNYLTWRKTLEEYQEAVQAFHQNIQQLKALQQEQQKTLEQQKTFEQQFAFLQDWLPLANKNLSEKMTLTADFAAEMQEIKLTRLQQPSTLVAQQLKRARESREELFVANKQLLAQIDLTNPAELSLWLKQWEQLQNQLTRKAELAQLLTPLFPDEITWEELLQHLAENQQTQQELQERLSALSEEKQRNQLQIEQLQVDGVLDELYQTESRLLSEINELALTWSTNQVLASFLNDLASELSEQQLPQLLKKASYYFALLTNNRYQRVGLTDGMLYVAAQEISADIYALSTGTKDQLIMAIRFAYLSMQKAAISPIIIDDGWLHYDSQRKAQLAKLFAEFGQKHQVICLSSDQEMVSYYQRQQQAVVEMNQGM